jgi:hypothetical protein
MNSGTELATDLFKKINGIIPTRAIQGHGSFITIDFGQDFSEQMNTRSGPKTRFYGEWRLWVYMCAWRIDIDKKPCAGQKIRENK